MSRIINFVQKCHLEVESQYWYKNLIFNIDSTFKITLNMLLSAKQDKYSENLRVLNL